MAKLLAVVKQSPPLEQADETLRGMAQEVPLEYVRKQLEASTEEGSPSSMANIGLLLRRINMIKSLDQDGAFAHVEQLKDDRNVDALCVSLCGFRTEAMQAKAAQALGYLGDPKAVRILAIQTLGAAAMPLGGTEGRLSREELRGSLVEALASCTGLDFSEYDVSEAATLKVVKRCQDRLEETGR